MTLLRRSLVGFSCSAVLYSGLWVAGLFVIQSAWTGSSLRNVGAWMSLLLEEFSVDESGSTLHSRRRWWLSVRLCHHAGSAVAEASAGDVAGRRKRPLRAGRVPPFYRDLDYSGSHAVSRVLQPPMRCRADRASRGSAFSPCHRRERALVAGQHRGEGAVDCRVTAPFSRSIALPLAWICARKSEPATLMLDVLRFALVRRSGRSSRYQDLLQRWAMLNRC